VPIGIANTCKPKDFLHDVASRSRALLDTLTQVADQSTSLNTEFQLLVERYDNRVEECRFWELQCHRLNSHCATLEDCLRNAKGIKMSPATDSNSSTSHQHSSSQISLQRDAMCERMMSFKELQMVSDGEFKSRTFRPDSRVYPAQGRDTSASTASTVRKRSQRNTNDLTERPHTAVRKNADSKARAKRKSTFNRTHFLALAADKDYGPAAAVEYLLNATNVG